MENKRDQDGQRCRWAREGMDREWTVWADKEEGSEKVKQQQEGLGMEAGYGSRGRARMVA